MQKAVDLMPRARRTDTVPRPYEDIGKRLAQLRRAYGLNQTEFAAGIGLKPNTYNLWESGERRPGIESALLIKKQYGATLDWLYAGDHSALGLRLVNAIQTGKKLT